MGDIRPTYVHCAHKRTETTFSSENCYGLPQSPSFKIIFMVITTTYKIHMRIQKMRCKNSSPGPNRGGGIIDLLISRWDNYLLHSAVSAADNSGVSRQVVGRQGKLVGSLPGPNPILVYRSCSGPPVVFPRLDSQREWNCSGGRVTIEELCVE